MESWSWLANVQLSVPATILRTSAAFGLDSLLFPARLNNLSAHSNKAFLECQRRALLAYSFRAGGFALDIETKTLDGVKLIKLKGRLSMGPPLDRFNSTLAELLSQNQFKIILDLEEVPTIDSSGIGMFVRYLTSCKQGGGSIRLLKPSKFTVQTLKMVGLLNLFTTFDDQQSAVDSFK